MKKDTLSQTIDTVSPMFSDKPTMPSHQLKSLAE